MHSIFQTTARALLLAGCSCLALGASGAMAEPEGPPFFPLLPGSVIVSSSTYDRTQGPIATLTAGVTELPNKKKGIAPAVAGNLYPEVWDNDSTDSSFGIASAIQLTAVDALFGHVLWTRTVSPDQVVTSFSSKSELALHVSSSPHGNVLAFTCYGVAGTPEVTTFGTAVGAIDISASDAVPGQDPTNLVTIATATGKFAYPGYAFARTVVAMDRLGNLTYTPTSNYGGDNSRAALLGSNGLYYTAGNSNNGASKTFGSGISSPDVTETTGLEVVDPINARTADASNFTLSFLEGNSAEVDPLQLFVAGDKAGKDTNFRGVTEFGGKLWVTKGSGGNGIDTLYTVDAPDQLPTVAQAPGAVLGIVPGFPTDPASDGGNFTPFGVFFANANTMYVADEGSGNDLDVASHAGLQKWSLVGGVWQLDYVLQNGLVGVVEPVLDGPDGQYPENPPFSGSFMPVTETGLRNLTGVVIGRTVVLWATTATNSSSSDPGADPNKVVMITDDLLATAMTPAVAAETFTTVLPPKYGVVYRGVAFVP
jgi:hypothetical protein